MPHESTSSVFVPDARAAACARQSDDTEVDCPEITSGDPNDARE
jgi:hypothetical protein